MFLLNPTYLWAFLGLTIPIAIHLWSKKEGKTIKIGSVQLLKNANTKQSKSVKLNEFWLLILRLFLLSIVVLIMSNLHVRKKVDVTDITYIVESSLLLNKEFKSILDTISTNASIRLLQKGFPEVDLEINYERTPITSNYWQLAKEMQSLPSDSIIVFTNAYQTGLKGSRPKIAKHIEWLPISIDKSDKHLLEAYQLNGQWELLIMNSKNEYISFDKELLELNNSKIKFNSSKDSIFYLKNWTAINHIKTPNVLLFYEADFIVESKYLEASFNVVSNYLNHKINLVKTDDLRQINIKEFDIVIWLSEKPMINTNGKVLLFKANQFAKHLIDEGPVQGIYHLTKFLDAENIEKDHLPEQLIQLLDLNPAIEQKIVQYDKRVLDKETIIPTYSNQKSNRVNNNSVDSTKWLWGLLIILLTSERIVSSYRQQ